MEIFTIVTLALSGLLLLMVGIARLSNPISNYAKNSGITIANDVDLLNEVRGTSAVMLLGAILVLLGILVPDLTLTSHIIATLLFLGFAVGRFVSIAADGQPNKKIKQGIVFELVLGTANVICLVQIPG
ncbi:DUF4345 domain-containing protein [Flagellimonas sp. S3867]|uniref:DUF4345 domain-containing protein n=1 Tax=Flagellimonas sp. S3867 TaxID=2768063 RepID=UPI0016859147|nr:DUF4345 domain-containing protein [Flagellimonas sp. S3867]